jgi:hypothetical protein
MTEEEELLAILEELRVAYEKATQPYLEILRRIWANQPPKPILLTREQAEAWGVILKHLQ